jgi:hypothetical protein
MEMETVTVIIYLVSGNSFEDIGPLNIEIF